MNNESRIEVPAGTGRAVRASRGQLIEVRDDAGGQIVDTWALSAADRDEYHSAQHTRPTVGRLFPEVGESFYSNKRREMLRLEADTSPGVHDMLVAACDPIRYREYGFDGYHPSCQENFYTAAEELGYPQSHCMQPINLFMNTPFLPDGNLQWRSTCTKAGDKIALRAMMDVILVVSACPMDLSDVNAHRGAISLAVTDAA